MLKRALLLTFVSGLLLLSLILSACFELERVSALAPGSVVGSAVRPDLAGSPGAAFVRVTGIGSQLVRVGDGDGAFVVGDLGPGRLDLRLIDDVDGDGWPNRGRDVSVFVASDLAGGRGAVDVGELPLVGTFGLRGVVTLPSTINETQVIRIFALRRRCAVGSSERSGSDLSDGACDDNNNGASLTRFEHGVEGEAAADDTGAWQLTRLVAGALELVAVLYEKNADGSLGGVIDVAGPFPFDGVASDAGDPPRDAEIAMAFDDVPPPAVSVQLSLSRPVENAAFAVFTPVGATLAVCTSARAAAANIDGAVVIDLAAGASSAVATVAAGTRNVLVCDGNISGAASFLAVPGVDTALWPVVMLDVDSCPLGTAAEPAAQRRNCDADAADGLSLAVIDDLRAECALSCFPDQSQPLASLGTALGDRTCTIAGAVYDCDDDADGQPDVTEPVACIGAGRGHDLDGDGLCSIVDSFPYCAANTASACPAGREEITPRVAASLLQGVVRGPVGTVVSIDVGDTNVVVTVSEAGVDGPKTLVYGEAPFSLPFGVDLTALTLTPRAPLTGVVCARVPGPRLVIGCEHRADHLSNDGAAVGTFYDGSDVVVGGLPDDGAEGRYVAFSTSAAIAGANGDARQVFWRDRGTGVTLLISATNGVLGNDASDEPAISADGLSVVFTSSATNLVATNRVATDDNGVADIFLWRAADPDVLERLSDAFDDTPGDGPAANASINANGSVVAFSSTASLIPDVTSRGTDNVFRKDVDTGVLTLVSARPRDGSGVGGQLPSISWDGTRIAFWSFAADLVDNDTNDLWDIFVYDHDDDGTVRRVSLTHSGGERNQGDESSSRIVAPAISGDGRFVGWASTSSNVVDGEDDNDGLQDVFVTTIETGEVIQASTTSGPGEGDTPRGQGERVAFSYDGRLVAFSSGSQSEGAVVVYDRLTSTASVAVPWSIEGVGIGVSVPAMSAGGAYVVAGVSNPLDARIPDTGIFAVFTTLAPSWWSVR